MIVLLYIATASTIFAAVGTTALLVFSRKPYAATERAVEVAKKYKIAAVMRRKEAWRQQVSSIGHWIRTRLDVAPTDKIRVRCSSAGLKTESQIDMYLAARLLVPTAAMILGSFIPFSRVFWIISLGAIGYLVPDMTVGQLSRRRRKKIAKSVPDAIDLLVICVDAGLGMDQAMLRVGQELKVSHPEINEEFLQIGREQRAGKPRIDAWRSMSERTALPEIDAFVNMLTQTERFGTPIARALSNYGDGIRLKRRQTAEQKAAKTTVKIIFPLVLCIFPSLFIVVVAPTIISMMRTLSGTAR